MRNVQLGDCRVGITLRWISGSRKPRLEYVDLHHTPASEYDALVNGKLNVNDASYNLKWRVQDGGGISAAKLMHDARQGEVLITEGTHREENK